MVLRRTETVKASGLTSSYKKKQKPKERWGVESFKEGSYITPDMLEALKKLDKAVRTKGGNLYITDLYRSWETQEDARNAFLNNKKKAFVAAPGKSFHNAGRAVDISVKELNFKEKEEDWLQCFWDISKPLGFYPVISIPDINSPEAWHFDFPGKDWEKTYKTISYSETAKCATIDIGGWNPTEKIATLKNMFIQAQLIRLGHYEIGSVDGILGKKTKEVLSSLNLGRSSIDDVIEILIKK